MRQEEPGVKAEGGPATPHDAPRFLLYGLQGIAEVFRQSAAILGFFIPRTLPTSYRQRVGSRICLLFSLTST